MNILILAAGQPRPKHLLQYLAGHCDWIIAADGGARLARRARLAVNHFVGDGDSLSRKERAWLEDAPSNVSWHPVEKDQTDLELALDVALEKRPDSIHIFGGWGLRADHTISNVCLLERAAEAGVSATLWAEGDQLRAYRPGSYTLPDTEVGQRLSLIPLSREVEGVLTQGLKYPLHQETLFRNASRGVSNEVVDLPVLVEFRQGTLLVVQAFSAKRFR